MLSQCSQCSQCSGAWMCEQSHRCLVGASSRLRGSGGEGGGGTGHDTGCEGGSGSGSGSGACSVSDAMLISSSSNRTLGLVTPEWLGVGFGSEWVGSRK